MDWSKTHEQENKDIVCGYVRNVTNDISIPVDIIDVVFKFFYAPLLIWDWEASNTQKLSLRSDTINTIERNGNGYASIISKNIISSKLYSKCYFEVLIEDFKEKNIDLFVGYVAYNPNKQYKFKDFVGSSLNGPGQFSVYCCQGWRAFGVYNKGKKKVIEHGTMSNRRAIGDKIGIEIDFETNKSKAFYNGQCVGVIFDHVPKVIVPAISMYYSSMVISSPTFQLFAKRSKHISD